MNKSARLFALAEALRARRTGVTAQQLADRFGVSVRTVMRDLDALRDAHVPVLTERGRGGGVVLDKSYAMPPVSFMAREALLLLVLGRFAREMRVMPFLQTLGTALDKVRAALPAQTQRQLQRMERSMSFVGVPALAVGEEVRAVVEQAFLEDAPLFVEYERPDGGVVRRHLRIDSVVLDRRETLLNCVDLELDEKRQFRLHTLLRAWMPRE